MDTNIKYFFLTYGKTLMDRRTLYKDLGKLIYTTSAEKLLPGDYSFPVNFCDNVEGTLQIIWHVSDKVESV